MEKFQIARYALMQVTALVYGILSCGVAVKASQWKIDYARPLPSVYYYAVFMRNYGVWFLLLIIGWTLLAAYYSSTPEREEMTPWWAKSAIIVCVLLVLGSTYFALGALITSLS